ncbi:hypothetical protein OGM63_10730 [Plectonema radiosum NIES-515]|uniref:Transposase n=1 Tax=Plectonema radiosum NIES-515 TaxID=2986073 RepID=A0ABT3AZG5_9CYAN|nr:hypothetical protein [Plectonema radiosum]MCV3213984.1 hypothetical protein [Plectonema radiosum NIES-515]
MVSYEDRTSPYSQKRSLVVEERAIALQKISKIKRRRVAACRQTSLVEERCDRIVENLKNKAIACCRRVSAIAYADINRCLASGI